MASKPVLISVAVLLAGLIVFSVFVAVAALDEFARIPFYRTLPASALLVNGISAYIFFRNRGRVGAGAGLYSRLISNVAPLGGGILAAPRHAVQVGRLLFRRKAAPRINRTRRHASGAGATTAWGNIHSIAWGFPTPNRVIHPTNHSERDNDQAGR